MADAGVPDPLARWNALASWQGDLKKGEGRWDALVSATTLGLEGQARVAVGITDSLSIGAEAFARGMPGGMEMGGIAGLSGRF